MKSLFSMGPSPSMDRDDGGGLATSQGSPASSGRISQTLIVASMLPETIRSPSALNSTLLTPAEWPWSVKTSRPVSASQSLIVRSRHEVAIRLPSGLKADVED